MLMLVAGALAGEDQINPAQRGGPDKPAGGSGSDHLPSYEMPAVPVQGHASSGLREEDRIGENLHPRWTARRRFGETRVYVRPAAPAAPPGSSPPPGRES